MQEILLDQLRDIHLPAAPGLWPPAPGWWLLGAVALGLLLYLSAKIRRRYHRAAPRRAFIEALQKVDTLHTDRALIEISRLLRRFMIACRGRETIARLHGAQWIEFIARETPQPFVLPQNVAEALRDAHFRPRADIDVSMLRHNLIEWARHFPVAPAPGSVKNA